MQTKEYYNTNEVAKLFNISTKTVLRRLKEFNDESESKLITKDNTGNWLIHKLALPRFKPTTKEIQYTALTIDTEIDYNYKDLHKVVTDIFEIIKGKVELNYSVELKVKDFKPHIHFYFPSDQFRKIFKELKTLLDFSYRTTPVFDLQGWKDYISKETKIITLSK